METPPETRTDAPRLARAGPNSRASALHEIAQWRGRSSGLYGELAAGIAAALELL
jgi:hypothetical protein